MVGNAGTRVLRGLLVAAALAMMLASWPSSATAAPYAAMVIDARDGNVIFARNHDTRLHPASLTKMMTLYIAFEAVKHGEVTLDTEFTVSRNAASTPCSCLGLRAGQRIKLRYLLRAAALRSANDASVVIAEGLSGSVEAFADRMNRTARAMGMDNTSFRNPHGLTQQGHMSTARDMTTLGRQLLFDYPQYYNLFSRRSDHAGIATVPNTNRRLLDAYSGADGIKTGFTRAAGFSLTASAQRGDVRIIATMFGGQTAASRNEHVAELLDIGFARAPSRVVTRAPATPPYQGRGGTVAVAQAAAVAAPAASAPRQVSAVARSLRPRARPGPAAEPAIAEPALAELREGVNAAVASVVGDTAPGAPDETAEIAHLLAPDSIAVQPPPRPVDEDILLAEAVASDGTAGLGGDRPDPGPEIAAATAIPDELARAAAAGFTVISPETYAARTDPAANGVEGDTATTQEPAGATADQQAQDAQIQLAAATVPAGAIGAQVSPEATSASEAAPPPRPNELIELTSVQDAPDRADDAAQVALVTEAAADPTGETVSRISSSGGRLWAVTIGNFTTRHDAERHLIQTALTEAVALENGLRRVHQGGGGFEAGFTGLTREEAEIACRRIQARNRTCVTVGP